MTASAIADGGGSRHFGVYPAIVTNIVDSDSVGRIEVRLPWLGTGEQDVRAWATLLSPYADNNQGIQILPEVDSQVVVAFEAGDLRRPYIIGACWNGREALPDPPNAANNKRLWKTRSGSVLEFDDAPGAPKISISTPSGNSVVLDDGAQEIRVVHANGCQITINIAGQIQLQANSTVELSAAALNVHCPASIFDGVISCTTLIASAGVVSPSYTPGAGNIW